VARPAARGLAEWPDFIAAALAAREARPEPVSAQLLPQPSLTRKAASRCATGGQVYGYAAAVTPPPHWPSGRRPTRRAGELLITRPGTARWPCRS
jgi:hypothetical protein